MRIKNFFLSLAAVALVAGFASCSSEEIVPGTDPVGPGTTEPQIGQDGVAYMKLALNLPMGGSVATGRANGDFHDGEEREFAVENAILVLFSAGSDADEDQAILRSAYTLSQSEWKKQANNQITSSTTVTTQVFTSNIPVGDNVYAYVILNKHSFFEVKKTEGKDYSSLFLGGQTDLENYTFEQIRTLELNEAGKDFTNQSFTMTNMPHLHAPGGATGTAAPATVKPWILMQADPTKVYGTESEAINGDPAVEIDVERLVAKVQVQNGLPTQVGGDDVTKGEGYVDNDKTKPKFTLMGWIVDNINTKATLSRKSADPTVDVQQGGNPFGYLAYTSDLITNNFYRFVENKPVHAEVMNGVSAYRTYWAIDNNYNQDATDLSSRALQYLDTRIQKFNADGTKADDGGDLRPFETQGAIPNYYYCPENTFDTQHQTVKNTTRVIVAAKFNNGDSFVTLSSAPNTIYTQEGIKTYIISQVVGRVITQNWLKTYFGGLDSDKVASLFRADVEENGNTPGKALATIELNEAKVTELSTDATSALTNWNSKLQADQTEYVKTNIQDQLNFYKGGIAYYQALIRHFNDSETPWISSTHMQGGNNVGNIYDLGTTITTESRTKSESRYLGRYGVVRNNWYDLTITKVSRIGSATVPELTDDPDDVVEQYVQVKINIMPWALRTQDVIL